MINWKGFISFAIIKKNKLNVKFNIEVQVKY